MINYVIAFLLYLLSGIFLYAATQVNDVAIWVVNVWISIVNIVYATVLIVIEKRYENERRCDN